jgi:TonB family protein
LYRSSQHQNNLVVLLVIFLHVLLLLGAFLLDIRKRVALDLGSMTGPIFVDLHQSIKLNAQTKKSDVIANAPRTFNNQKSVDTEGGLTDKPPTLNNEGIDRNVGGGIEGSHPTKIDGPKPHYPIASRRLREEGEVLVRLCIDSRGEVEKAQIQKSSGYQNLDHSALSALSKWRFVASSQLLNSSFAECFRFPVRFTLEG